MNTGSALARFTITLSTAVTEPVQVEWHTSDGTAKATVDYAANKGIVVFAPGETAKTVDILVYGRAVGTEDRYFYVEMLPPTNAILGASIGECIIHVDTTGSTPVTQIIVPTGPQGIQGKSAYQSYLDTTTDNPPMTEPEWVESLKGDPEEIAQEVAPLIDVGNTVLTAEGTEALGKPDATTVKAVARRVAYSAPARIATVTLSSGDNTLSASDLTGDSIDFNAIGFVPKVLHAGVMSEPNWTVNQAGKLVVIGATAGDVLYAVQYDSSSTKRHYAAQENTESSYYQKIRSFEEGSSRPLNSKRDVLLYQAGNSGSGEYYYWDGALPKSVPPGSTPASSGGVGIGLWVSVGSATTREDLSKSDGFKLIGGVNSFAELRQLLPTAANIRVKLHGWRSGSTIGEGEFISVAGDFADDGGMFARVNSAWAWKRIIHDRIYPEMFGAYGDNVNDDAAALNACFACSAANGLQIKPVRRVTYLCKSTLSQPSFSRVNGINKLMSIRRDISVDTALDFLTLGSDSEMKGVNIIGNRNQSQAPAEVVLIRVGNRVHLKECSISGSVGYGVVANATVGVKIIDCDVSDTAGYGIAMYGDGTSNSADFEISGLTARDIGSGAVAVQGYSYGKVKNFDVKGTYVGGPGNRMYVTTNTNGTVTASSGPDFSALKPGMWLVLPGGSEHRITAVSSITNMTVSPPPPNNGTFRAIAGTGDLIGIQSCSFTKISDGIIEGAVTYGTGGGTMAGSSNQCNYNEWTNITIRNTGKNGFNLGQSGASCSSNAFKKNKLILCGSGGIGSGPSALLPAFDTNAIALYQATAGMLANTTIDDNEVITFTGDLGAGEAWLGMQGLSAGTVTCKGNKQDGYADGFVRGDIINITLTGYGTGATVTNNVSNGESVIVSIQPGTTPTASPFFNVTKVIRTRTAPIIMAQIATTTGLMAHCWGMQTSTPSNWAVGRNTAPTGNDTYHITAV